jgi:DNA polymerase (family 10)
MQYIEPEMRENRGEIELARQNKLPRLIGYGDLRGDLQTQTNWTDGANSIEEMAEAALGRGLEYIVITDHTKRLAMTNGLDDRRVQEQVQEIRRLNVAWRRKGRQFRILSGTECDILKDGRLDLSDTTLEELDVVGVSVHSLFHLSETDQTERILTAMRNPHADILFHPTGRLIQRREAYAVDVDAVITGAKETGTVLEINAFPNRLDLNDEYIQKCVQKGVRLAIDSDAHAAEHFTVLEYGIAQARRGWATKKDIVNAWPVEKMLGMLKDGVQKKRR